MQCLMRYRWVKLPRACLPDGKGVMGAWARLAARAAFRKGEAEYCGHINAVTPGMWAGGVVGLKSILGLRSREKALGTLAELSERGYLQYALDRRTKKLTYEISDWVVECSGAACEDGAVYATNNYGFLCLPRNITERLAAAHYTFEDADAWLDLWCHTVWNDPHNAFSFLTPAVQYRFAGAVLSLETLGQRWGWEKTKVWRFFQKHGDAFALYRLPGSYGCLIFNKQYPTGTAGPVPKKEDIAQLFQRFRAYAAGASCSRSGLNRIIRLYSHSAIAQMGLERQEVPAENRVADLAPIYRAYISLCRNCKNCWNYVYDCRGDGKTAVYAENEIRGPTRPVDLTRMTKELFHMDNDNAIYEQQEEQMKARTEAFIKLLTQRGILEDKKIKDAHAREVQRSKRQLSYHNTMMLLKNYRTIAWIVECFPDTIAEELERPFERTDALLDHVDVELCMGNRKLESRLEGVQHTRLLLDRVNEALTVLRKKPGDGAKLYDLIYLTYISPEKLTHPELLYRLGLSSRQYYRLREQAIAVLSIRLWSAPAKDMDCWLEVLTAIENAR